jgi:hypothetical protein
VWIQSSAAPSPRNAAWPSETMGGPFFVGGWNTWVSAAAGDWGDGGQVKEMRRCSLLC